VPSNKRHHYVPAFYLRRFSSDGNSINLYNIPSSRRVEGANLRRQCYRNYMYGADPALERGLAGAEGELAALLRKMDQYRDVPPPFTPDHVALALYFAMQESRTQYAADQMDEMHDQLVQRLMGPVMAAKGIDLSQFRVTLKHPVLLSMSVALESYPLLLDMAYKLLVNQTSEEFVTSDNPVVSYNQLLSFRTFGSNCGLACKGLQMFLPLDHQKMLLLFDPVAYRVGQHRRTVVEVTSPQDVYALNTLQACAASANIYFHGDALDTAALHRKAAPFFRSEKATVRAFQNPSVQPGQRQELVTTSRSDIRTNLSLSFVTLRTFAKRWRDRARQQKMQPGAEVRNPELVDGFREFRTEVKAGKYRSGDFLRFMADTGLTPGAPTLESDAETAGRPPPASPPPAGGAPTGAKK
jgi:hypothetical protein